MLNYKTGNIKIMLKENYSLSILGDDLEDTLLEMKKAGVMYGHLKSFCHPQADYFTIKTNQAQIAFINLEETIKALERASQFIQEIIQNRGIILFIGTQPGAREIVKELAEKYDFPYVINRWLGGTLTNFSTLSSRIQYLQELEAIVRSERWEKLTKRERTKLTQEMNKLQKKFIGLRNLKTLPNSLFVIDPKIHTTAIREARKLNIPIISILDTDDDPSVIDYPIPANDSAKSSLTYILNKIEEIIAKSKAEITSESLDTNQEANKPEKNEEIITRENSKV